MSSLRVPEMCTDQITSSPELAAGGAIKARCLAELHLGYRGVTFRWEKEIILYANLRKQNLSHPQLSHFRKLFSCLQWSAAPLLFQRGLESSATAGSRICCLTTVSPICRKSISGPRRTQKFGSPGRRTLKVEMGLEVEKCVLDAWKVKVGTGARKEPWLER